MRGKNNSSADIGIEIKSFIPCKLVYPYGEYEGIPQYHTCVEVFRHLPFFDFPSIPRNILVYLLMDVSKNSYNIGMNIVDDNGNKIIKEKIEKINIPLGYGTVDFTQTFERVVFPKDGKYFFQLIINDKVFYKHDFLALKIQKKEYTPQEIKNILEDPETVKSTFAILECGCGHKKVFSITLDPKKQKEEEKLPNGNIINCEECGKEMNIAEVKANMCFFLGTKNLVDVFNRNLNESRILGANGFLNSSLIMQVSAFEAFMRDSFLINHKNWFIYILDKELVLNKNINNFKQKILNILTQMKLKEQFIAQIFLLNNQNFKSELDKINYFNDVIKTLISGDDVEDFNKINKFISFQQLKDTFGCFWAYKNFFGIDLKKELDKQRNNYFEHLLKCFQIRHRIIHGSAKVQLFRKEVDTDLIKKNEEIILFIRESIKKKFNDVKEKRKEFEKNISINNIKSNRPELVGDGQ